MKFALWIKNAALGAAWGVVLTGILWADDAASPSAPTAPNQEETPALAAAEIPAAEIPAWAQNAIQETFERFSAWKGTDETVVLPTISDVHSGRGDFAEPLDWSDSKNHIRLLQHAAVVFGADATLDLGDIGFDRLPNWKPSDEATARQRLQSQRALYENAPVPAFFCMGNHDSGRSYGETFSELRLSERDYGEMFNGATKNRGVEFSTGPNQDYGYWDVPEKSCRVIFLNTSDSAEVGYSDDQVRFLLQALETADGRTVVVFEHVCLHPTIGDWYDAFPGGLFKHQRTVIHLLQTFALRTKEKIGDFESDFESAENTSLAGVIAGDSHFDAQSTRYGVNYAVTQGYGTVSARNVPEEGAYTPFERSNSMLCDVVAIKPTSGEMKIFRIGAGGESRDRTFHFNPVLSNF